MEVGGIILLIRIRIILGAIGVVITMIQFIELLKSAPDNGFDEIGSFTLLEIPFNRADKK